ncbi:MAG: HAD-IIIC family phosphatase [Paracoccaceae bacterium]
MKARDELLTVMAEVLGDEAGFAVVHSSLAALAPEGGISRWDLLFGIKELVRRGWTLTFPSFTFSFCRDGVFSRESSASETGVLADWVLSGLAGAMRTEHPIYSFVVVGVGAHDVLSCRSETTFGDTSPFGLFEQRNAQVVMLGADWRFATPFHRYEEKASVPYRLFKTFYGKHLSAGHETAISAEMYVRDLDIGAVNDFSTLVAELREAGKIVTAPLWRGSVEATTMRSIRDVANSLLKADPLAFVANKAETRFKLEVRDEAARHDPFRIAVLGRSNLDLVADCFRSELANLVQGRDCRVHVPPFGQLSQQIIDPYSELSKFDPEISIFADRLEDIANAASLDLVDGEIVRDLCLQHAKLIREFAQNNRGTVIVHRFAFLRRSSADRVVEMSRLVMDCNGILDEVLGDIERVVWLDLASEAAQANPASDIRLWNLGRIPFSDGFGRQLARRWAGCVLAQLGKTARLIVLDLDNTLWGGVLGEDGASGISIGGDFPGNAFRQFQATLKSLSDRGIALAVCSKNDEDLALGVLSSHESIIIRPDDLVAHRINWQPKWQNIAEISRELDLGLGSIMFIDDNPVEREAVRRNLPMVQVLDLPPDPALYVDTLLNSPFVEVINSGHEDRKRVASYKARRKIKLERQSAASIEDFLRGLGMQLRMQRIDASNLARAAQLCQKTNQFNTTTRRYSERDLERMVAEGADVAVIGLQDKYTEAENIGLIVLAQSKASQSEGIVDLFLLSCRVLGRTVEQAVMCWAVDRSYRRGWDALVGEIEETPRNTPARSVFAENGFKQESTVGLWRRETSAQDCPDWFDLYDEFA